MEPMIEFMDFSFKYRAQKEPTLRNINLTIMPGEKVLIVGPSGCGAGGRKKAPWQRSEGALRRSEAEGFHGGSHGG